METSLIVLSLTVHLAFVFSYTRHDCFCGVSNAEGRRITNGVVAKPNKYPWMVPLFTGKQMAHCSGALISDQHVTSFRLRNKV